MCDRIINLQLIFLPIIAQCNRKKVNVLGSYFQDTLILIACNVLKGIESNFQVQSNLVIRNFLVTILFLNAKCSLSMCNKFEIGGTKHKRDWGEGSNANPLHVDYFVPRTRISDPWWVEQPVWTPGESRAQWGPLDGACGTMPAKCSPLLAQESPILPHSQGIKTIFVQI